MGGARQGGNSLRPSGKVDFIHLGLLEELVGLKWKEANASLAQCRLPLPTYQPTQQQRTSHVLERCVLALDVIAKRESHVLVFDSRDRERKRDFEHVDIYPVTGREREKSHDALPIFLLTGFIIHSS